MKLAPAPSDHVCAVHSYIMLQLYIMLCTGAVDDDVVWQ